QFGESTITSLTGDTTVFIARVTNHTGVLFKKLIWRFELFLHEGDMIFVLASADPELHPAKDEHRIFVSIITRLSLRLQLKWESLATNFLLVILTTCNRPSTTFNLLWRVYVFHHAELKNFLEFLYRGNLGGEKFEKPF
ncbi:hypothetical protein MKW98_013915, partial [Papaver atlanticum]